MRRPVRLKALVLLMCICSLILPASESQNYWAKVQFQVFNFIRAQSPKNKNTLVVFFSKTGLNLIIVCLHFSSSCALLQYTFNYLYWICLLLIICALAPVSISYWVIFSVSWFNPFPFGSRPEMCSRVLSLGHFALPQFYWFWCTGESMPEKRTLDVTSRDTCVGLKCC